MADIAIIYKPLNSGNEIEEDMSDEYLTNIESFCDMDILPEEIEEIYYSGDKQFIYDMSEEYDFEVRPYYE